MVKLKMDQIKVGAGKMFKASTEFVKFNGFFRKFIMLSLLLLFFNVGYTTPKDNGNNCALGMEELVYAPSQEEIYVNDVRTKMKAQLVLEVEKYITKIAPTSKLTPEYLVNKCLEYDTDIIFVLSQALLESHFGTKGKAFRTNSVWNVGTYDDGQILYTYKTANESLEPYLKLINEKYLINVTADGDTIIKDLIHLVQDKGYINYNGNRFASAKGYENGMRKLMVRIDMKTSIGFYQDFLKLDEYEILSYFNPNRSDEIKLDYILAQK